MIETLYNGAFYYEASSNFEGLPLFFEEFKTQAPTDLILDCTSSGLPTLVTLQPLLKHQQQQERQLVLVIPVDQDHFSDQDIVTVPTKTEASDFIDFEIMQRDLGF